MSEARAQPVATATAPQARVEPRIVAPLREDCDADPIIDGVPLSSLRQIDGRTWSMPASPDGSTPENR